MARGRARATAPRWRPATPTSARPRGLVEHARGVVGIDAHLFENGVGVRHRRGQRHRRCAGPARPARSGSATSAAPPPTTTTGATSRRAVVEPSSTPTRTPSCGSAATSTPTDGGHRPARRSGAGGSRSPPGTACRTLLRDLDVNLAPLEPGSRFNDAKSAIKWLEAALVGTPDHRQPVGTVPRRHRRRAHRLAGRRPGGLGRRCLDRALATTATSARWSAPGPGGRRCCAGHRTCRATATSQILEPRCCPATRAGRPPARGRRGRPRRTRRCPLAPGWSRTRCRSRGRSAGGCGASRGPTCPRCGRAPHQVRRSSASGSRRRESGQRAALRAGCAEPDRPAALASRPPGRGSGRQSGPRCGQRYQRMSGAEPAPYQRMPSLPPALKAPTTGSLVGGEDERLARQRPTGGPAPHRVGGQARARTR